MNTNRQQSLIVEKLKAKKLTVTNDNQPNKNTIIQTQFLILDYKLSVNAKSNCYLGLIPKTKELVAVKIIQNNKASNDISGYQQFVEKCQRQLSNLYKATQQFKPSQFSNVSNIVYVYPFNYFSKKGTHAYIFMEFCRGGDLQAEINVRRINGKWFTFGQLYNIFKQLFNGYDQLYRAQILHQDLKPANILISEGVLKIGNFGLSYKLGDLNTSIKINGSPYYTAPQKYQTNYTPSTVSDIFSLGVIMYELVFDENPYWTKKQSIALKSKIAFKDWIKQKKVLDQQLYKEALQNQLNIKINLKKYCKNQQQEKGMTIMLQIIRKMLDKDPKNRITFQQIQLQLQKLSLFKTQLINFLSSKSLPKKLSYVQQLQSNVNNEPLKFEFQQLAQIKQRNPSLYVIREQTQKINILSNLLFIITRIIQIQIKSKNINDQNIKNLCNKLIQFNYCLTYKKLYQILTSVSQLDKDNLMSFYHTNIDHLVNNTKNNQQILQSLILTKNIKKQQLNQLLQLQTKQLYENMSKYLNKNIRQYPNKYLAENVINIYMFIYLLFVIVDRIGYNYTLQDIQEQMRVKKQMELKIDQFKYEQVISKLQEFNVKFTMIQYQ